MIDLSSRGLLAPLCLVVLLSCSWAALPAGAAVDLTDPWTIEFDVGGAGVLRLVQSGTVLMTTLPPGGSAPVFAGTIDPDSGVFHLDATYLPPDLLLCSASVDATAAPDGLTFSGTVSSEEFSCSGGPPTCVCLPPLSVSISGVRCPACTACGDGVIDAGEQCDDGNTMSGDCCSATCTLEAAGGPCATDFNQCTDDVCDGAGVCSHVPNSDPCGGTTCLPRTCSGGHCLGAAAPAGTSCVFDAETCTVDTCDGAGQCVGLPHDDCQMAGHRSSILLDRSNDQRRALRWKGVDDSGTTAAADLGDPAVSADYRMCVFAGANLLLSAGAPAGGQCGARPCWRSSRGGFAYGDRDAASDGLRVVRVRAAAGKSAKMRVRGKGPGLPLTGSLAVPSVRAQLLVSDGDGTRCWESDFDNPSISTPTRFKARR